MKCTDLVSLQTGKVPCIEVYFGDYAVSQDLAGSGGNNRGDAFQFHFGFGGADLVLRSSGPRTASPTLMKSLTMRSLLEEEIPMLVIAS